MERDADSTPYVLPPALLAAVEAAAMEEQRPVADVLQDAVTRYVRESRWQRMLAAGKIRARMLGLTEDDVPRLIAQFREDRRQGP